MAIDYERVRDEVHRAGEIIVFTDAGQEFELHNDDVVFKDRTQTLEWKSGDNRWILDGNCVESIEVHSSHRMS